MWFSFENLVPAQAAGRGIRAPEGYVTEGTKRKHHKKDEDSVFSLNADEFCTTSASVH